MWLCLDSTYELAGYSRWSMAIVQKARDFCSTRITEVTPEGLERLMRAIDDMYGVDHPPCSNCGHAPKEHGRAAMKCEAFLVDTYVTDRAHGYWTAADMGRTFRRDRPCPCDCYDEPEASRLAHSR